MQINYILPLFLPLLDLVMAMAGTIVLTDLSKIRTTCTEEGQFCFKLDGTYVHSFTNGDPKAVRYCAVNVFTGGQGMCYGIRYIFWLIRYLGICYFQAGDQVSVACLKDKNSYMVFNLLNDGFHTDPQPHPFKVTYSLYTEAAANRWGGIITHCV
jgi:hypothetical protein